jgi:leucyl-tRNA synthetase
MGGANSIHLQSWPEYDPALTVEETVIVGIQVNGKIRGEIRVAVDEGEDSVRARVLEMPAIQKWTADKEIKKFIYLAGKIVSIVIV